MSTQICIFNVLHVHCKQLDIQRHLKNAAVFISNIGDLLMQFCMITHTHTHTHTQPAGFWLASAQWSTFYTAVSQKLHLCIIHLPHTHMHVVKTLLH